MLFRSVLNLEGNIYTINTTLKGARGWPLARSSTLKLDKDEANRRNVREIESAYLMNTYPLKGGWGPLFREDWRARIMPYVTIWWL